MCRSPPPVIPFSVSPMENIDLEISDKDHLRIGRLFDRPSSSMFKQLAPNPGLLMAAYLPNLGDVSEYFSC